MWQVCGNTYFARKVRKFFSPFLKSGGEEILRFLIWRMLKWLLRNVKLQRKPLQRRLLRRGPRLLSVRLQRRSSFFSRIARPPSASGARGFFYVRDYMLSRDLSVNCNSPLGMNRMKYEFYTPDKRYREGMSYR